MPTARWPRLSRGIGWASVAVETRKRYCGMGMVEGRGGDLGRRGAVLRCDSGLCSNVGIRDESGRWLWQTSSARVNVPDRQNSATRPYRHDRTVRNESKGLSRQSLIGQGYAGIRQSAGNIKARLSVTREASRYKPLTRRTFMARYHRTGANAMRTRDARRGFGLTMLAQSALHDTMPRKV